MRPYHGRAFPGSQVPKAVERLAKLGVLKLQLDSKWTVPRFIMPKKTYGCACQSH